MARRPARARTIGRDVDEVEARHAARSAVLSVSLLDDSLVSGRDAGGIAAVPGFDLVSPWPASDNNSAVRSYLEEVEDRRSFHPDREVKPRSTRSWRPRLAVPTAARSKPRSYGLGSIAFKAGKKVAICIRRKMRRRALMAKGKGGGNHRRPRRNRYSNIWC
jgi:hypothetical protein